MTALYAISALWSIAVCGALQWAFIFYDPPKQWLEGIVTTVIVLGLLWAELAIARVAWQVTMEAIG